MNPRAAGHRRPRTAFSFLEVMCAVIILGIGFIMIALMFPVAISQTRLTTDETNGAALAGNAAAYVAAISSDDNLRASDAASSGQVLPVGYPIGRQLRSQIISSDSPRYAWMAFYSRRLDPTGAARLPFAQITLFCLRATNAPIFTPADVSPADANHWANLQPRLVAVKICNANGGADLIGFHERSPADHFVDAVAEGSFVIVSDDQAHGGRLNGQVFRVGIRRDDVDGQSVISYGSNSAGPTSAIDFSGMKVFELQPGNDFEPLPRDASGAEINGIATATSAWIAGRSFSSPEYSADHPSFEGPAMDVGVYTTFVPCRP